MDIPRNLPGQVLGLTRFQTLERMTMVSACWPQAARSMRTSLKVDETSESYLGIRYDVIDMLIEYRMCSLEGEIIKQ